MGYRLEDAIHFTDSGEDLASVIVEKPPKFITSTIKQLRVVTKYLNYVSLIDWLSLPSLCNMPSRFKHYMCISSNTRVTFYYHIILVGNVMIK